MTRTHWQSIACALAALAAAAPATAQRATLKGQVVDATSGQPIPAAVVEVMPRHEKALTDAQGRFTVRTTLGEHVIVADALGFGSAMTPVELADAEVEVQVALAKDPVMLERIVATASRLESRRRAYPRPVRVLNATEIAASGAPDISMLVRERLGVYFTECSRFAPGLALATSQRLDPFAGASGYMGCVYSRGGAVHSSIYVDEVRMPDTGILALYSPQEVAAVEVYHNGEQIRIYTRWFMEWAARTNYRPLPLSMASF
ncbi:MAG TPA: carboxypeptidase regulatory-like domain-containing protein [Longimicrobium sp.]|jgi:hypothetical protein|nr:carboxypeptidase regulatory-like domain-containing protein [Longimicrobium sp.]